MAQLELLEYNWRRNIHTKINLDGPSQPAAYKADKTKNKKGILKKIKNLCGTLPEIMSKLSNENLESCLNQIHILKEQWKCSKQTSIDVLNSIPRKQTDDSNDACIGLIPNGKSRYKTKGNSTSTWKKKRGKSTKAQGTQSQPENQVQVQRELTEVEKEIVQSMTQRGCVIQWSSKDFDVLGDNTLKGTELYLNDYHMEYAMCLLRNEFPHIRGLEDTLLYDTEGFKPNEGALFVQPIHAGYKHWVCLSNIQTTSMSRDCQVDLYDSMYSLPENPCKSDLAPAVVWQAAQILRKQGSHKNRSLFITVREVEQQRNAVDCGLFAIFNATTLLSGKNPSEVHYHPLLREILLKTLTAGTFDQSHILGERSDRSNYKFQHKIVSGNITHNVDIPCSVIEIQVYCHCQMPESFGDLIQCHKCEQQFHSSCYLISNKVAEELDSFICYDCREPRNYAFFTDPCPFNLNDSILLLERVKASGQTFLRKLLPMASARPAGKRLLISNLAQLKTLENIMSSFDLTTLKFRGDELYKSILSICQEERNHNRTLFERLNTAELVHFGLLVICDLLNMECKPIYSFNNEQNSLTSDDEVSDFLKLNKNWVKKIGTELSDLIHKVNKFCEKKKKSYEKSKDFLTESNYNLDTVKSHLRPIMSVSIEEGTSTKHTKKIEELKLEAIRISKQVELSKAQLLEQENKLLKR